MAPSKPVAEVKSNADGSVTVQYVPSSSGSHDISITYNEQPVAGTPLRLNVDPASGKIVTAYGSGLLHGGSGEKLEFYVTGSKQDIDVSIEGPGKADVLSKEEKGGVVTVVYTPMSPGEYDIHIKHKGKAIHGSPFSAKISGEGRKRSQLAIPASSEYNLGGASVDLTNVVGILKAPNGSAEPCLLKRMPDGKLGIAAFQPKQKGNYKLEVNQDGKPIAGSPFQIAITDQNICSAHQVKVSGAFNHATANKWNDVNINIAEAGFGSLGVSVEGAHRSDLELKGTSPTDYSLQYKPHEPGVYMLNIKFGDDHIAGSPFLVSVGGEQSGRVRETVVKDVHQIPIAYPNEDCHLELKIPGTDPLDMEATLTSPSGKSELCEIRGMPDNLCSLRFKPQEEGVNTISLKCKGIHFAGSPFQYTVGKVPSGGTHKLEFGGPGVEQGDVEAKNEFNIYYREAGPGKIEISVEGPSKAKMEVIDKGNGYITVGYIVQKEGDYGIHVKFNDEHVPESPAMVHVLPVSRDAKKVEIVGLRDRGLDVNKPATFSVQMNGAVGTLKAHVSTPSGTEEDVFIQEIDDDKNSLRFLPKENGIYYVHIKLDESHIPGSPLPMLIGKMGADPALVFANGAGLEKAEVGKAAKFTVVTNNAGSGTLAVNVDGPSRVALVCTEVQDGYEFSYTPMSPGVYMIMIKYSNVTIAGAPFKVTVTGQGKKGDINETSSIFVETVEKKPGVVSVKKFHGNASRVVATGNGLKKGFCGRPAVFTLDFKDAGQGQFTLGMLSPSGNPVQEISFKKARAKVYNVSYVAAEKGDHSMIVRYGHEDIPGSPFSIPIA